MPIVRPKRGRGGLLLNHPTKISMMITITHKSYLNVANLAIGLESNGDALTTHLFQCHPEQFKNVLLIGQNDEANKHKI
jgi:hypothetical protein